MSLSPQSLLQLQILRLDYSNISIKGLESLLNAAPNLETLYLDDCDNLRDDLHLAPLGLLKLQKLYLRNANISTESIQEFLDSASNIKELYPGKHPIRSLRLTTQKLEVLELKFNHLSINELQALLNATPELKSLNLRACKNLSGSLRLAPNSLPQLEVMDLAFSTISIEGLQTLIEAAPNLKSIDLAYCARLGGSLQLAPNSLLQLETVDLRGIPVENRTALENAAPRLKTLMSHRQSETVAESSQSRDNTIATCPEHQTSNYINIEPTPADFKFQYEGFTNNTLSQHMIIEKLSQYLSLRQQSVDLIPKIQDGICSTLSRLFYDLTVPDYSCLIDCIAAWNGQFKTISIPLQQAFDKLTAYITDYHFTSSKTHHFLGDRLSEFLRHPDNEDCILSSSWHAIALKKIPGQPVWHVYNPNEPQGIQQIQETELLPCITRALGVLVSAQHPSTDLKARAINADQFIQEGGLLGLTQFSNAAEILASLPSTHHYSSAALQGLLHGVPAWAAGLNKALTLPLTMTLLDAFIQNNPGDYQDQLQKSMRAMKAEDKINCLEVLSRTQTSMASTSQSAPLTRNLTQIIREIPDTTWYEQRLQTWKKSSPPGQNLHHYTADCLHANAVSKRLIECSFDFEVDGLCFALEKAGEAVYYINSPEDLVCSAPFIQRKGNTGQLRKGPGGPLHRFLTANHGDKTPVLVINYANFNTDDLIRLNTLIDKERRVDGTPLPGNMKLIGILIDVLPALKGEDPWLAIIKDHCSRLVPAAGALLHTHFTG